MRCPLKSQPCFRISLIFIYFLSSIELLWWQDSQKMDTGNRKEQIKCFQRFCPQSVCLCHIVSHAGPQNPSAFNLDHIYWGCWSLYSSHWVQKSTLDKSPRIYRMHTPFIHTFSPKSHFLQKCGCLWTLGWCCKTWGDKHTSTNVRRT